MRTLKKVLALSLVFAMAFTMMAGAAFKDQDKIDSSLTDDIQLLTALGVFQGDENGNFNPTDNVKRSEAAKMIYVLKNNGVDDGAVAFQGVSKYADVPVGHWAEGYINYCTNLGYMGGWKEGNVQKFDPNGNLTGVEFTKMLLCMIGYKADVQGYTGNGWQTNVLVDAATSGVTVNFEPSVYAATPRQWTARLMTNAINAPFVTYNRGELMYGTWARPDMSYAEQYLGLVTVEGTLEATNHNKLASDIAVSSSFNDTDTVKVQPKTGDAVYAVGDADENLLGQPVKMYYKKASGVNTENKLYAVLPYVKEGKIVNTTVDAVKVDSKNPKKITVDGLGTKTYGAQKINVYVNNVLVKSQGEMDAVAKKYLGTNSTDAVTLVADKDNYITKVLINDMVAYGRIDKIDAEKNTLVFKDVSKWLNGKANGNKLLAADSTTALVFDNSSANKENFNKYLNVASDVKAGSIVKIVANTSSGKLVYDITLADKIEGTPSGYTLDSNGKYATLTINGESVKLAGSDNFLSQYKWETTGTSVVNDKVFYTDGKYVIFSEGGTTSASVENLAYITAVDVVSAWGKTSYKVKALLADGTLGEYEVAGVYDEVDVKVAVAASVATGSNTSVNGSNLAEADRYSTQQKVTDAMNGIKEDVLTYTISDGKITLRVPKTDSNITFANGTQEYKHANKTVSVGGTSYKLDDNAYFFVKNSQDPSNVKYSVVKASELGKDQTSTAAASYAHKSVNGIPTFLFGVLNLNSSLVASDAEYAFVKSAASYALVDGKHTVQMTVANNKGEEVIIKKTYNDLTSANSAISAWNGLRGKVVTYTVNSDGYVVETAPELVATGTPNTLTADKWNKMEIEGWSNTVANVKVGTGNAQLVNVASDVKIHYVDATSNSNYASLTTGSGVENTVTNSQQSAYAYVQNVNGADTITDIFVEVSGADISKVW